MYMTYNRTVLNGSNITGIVANLQPKHKALFYIPVTDREVALYKANPNRFRIDDNAFAEIPRSPGDVHLNAVMAAKPSAREAIVAPIIIGKMEYIPDLNFQINVSMSLHLLSHKQKEAVKLWCKIDNEWVMHPHTIEEMLLVAKALVERREQISAQLYKD